MKKCLITLAIACLIMPVAATASSHEEEAMALVIQPIEIYACNFNEGQTMADLGRVTAEWNAWMDANQRTEYWAYTMVPIFHSSELTFDVAWVGGWGDGATMAESLEFWITKGGELQAKFAAVVDCNIHTNFAVMNVQPSPNPFQSGPIEFTDCTLKDGREFPEAVTAMNEWVAYERENGIEAGHWVLFPAYGESTDATYNFKWVTSSSYGTLGRAYDQYGTGGGWEKAAELFGELMKCDSPRLYHGTPVRTVELGE